MSNLHSKDHQSFSTQWPAEHTIGDQHNPMECPICNSWYSVTDDQLRVRSLGCGHSMCTSCLQRMHQRNSVTCPTCRYVHQTDSVDRIPICFIMESVIQSRDLSESSPVLNGGLCQKHATMKLFYCDTCKMFICAHCTVLDHPRGDEHKIIDIQAALSNKKSSNVSNIDCEIKDLQDVQNIIKDRLNILDDEKAIHSSLLQGFENVMSQIQKNVADVDAQHAMETVLMQEVQQKMNHLSLVKLQFTITETLTELSAAEQDCSTSVREARDWINCNKDSQDFSQLQIRSKATATSGRYALTTFDAANKENGRNGIIVLHMTKKGAADVIDIGIIIYFIWPFLTNCLRSKIKPSFKKKKVYSNRTGKDVLREVPLSSPITLEYSSVIKASESSDFIINCKGKGECRC
ncbi:unnamed protein product, partial [Meganyctiphanes norvegica]